MWSWGKQGKEWLLRLRVEDEESGVQGSCLVVRGIEEGLPLKRSQVADGEKAGVKAWRMLASSGLRVWLQMDDCHPLWNDTRRLPELIAR